MRYSNDSSLQAQQVIDSVQQGLDKAISSKDTFNDNFGFRKSHSAQKKFYQSTIKGSSQKEVFHSRYLTKEQKQHGITAYYANDMNAPDPEELSRQINSAYVAPLYDTDAGYAYQEIDKWTRPAANLANSFGTIGTGSATRQDLMNHINERKAIKKLKKFGQGDDSEESINFLKEFHESDGIFKQQSVIDKYNKSHQELVSLKLSGDDNIGLQGYHDKYLEAGRFGRRSVAREQRRDKELKQAQNAIIHTRYDDIRTMQGFHKDYVIDGETVQVKSKKAIDEAIKQVSGWLNKKGINIETMSTRKLKAAIKTGRLNGIALNGETMAEMREALFLRQKKKAIDQAEGNKNGLKAAPKMIVHETIGKTDAGQGYRIGKTALKVGEMGTSAALVGVESVTNAGIGLTRTGARIYDFAYKKRMNSLIEKGNPAKKAARELRLENHKAWTGKVKDVSERLKTAQGKVHSARQQTTKFLNGNASTKVKVLGKTSKKAVHKIDNLSGKVFKKKISETAPVSKVLEVRKNLLNRRAVFKQRIADSKIGKKLAEMAKRFAKFVDRFNFVKKVAIIGIAAFLLISAASFAIVASSVGVASATPGAGAEEEGFLQGVVTDMQQRQEQYENYILYGQNSSSIDTSQAHCNGILVNGTERSDVNTDNGIAKARIPMTFSDQVRITTTTTTYNHYQVPVYRDDPVETERTVTTLTSHQHKKGEKNAVCEAANADNSDCSICKAYKRKVKLWNDLNKKYGTNKPVPAIEAHKCTYTKTETVKDTSYNRVIDHYENRTDTRQSTTTDVVTRTVHGYANSDGLTAFNAEVSIPDGGWLSDAKVEECETDVTYKFVDSQGRSEYVDEDGVVHQYDQADLYKAILSMATVALGNDCSNKAFYEQYCYKLLDSVYNAGYTVSYTVSKVDGSNNVKWKDTTPLTRDDDSAYDADNNLIKSVTRTQDPTELSADSYKASAEVIIYLDSGLPDLANKDTTDNAWMRLNGYKSDEYAPNVDDKCNPVYDGLMKVTGYQDKNGNAVDMNDPTKFANFWSGWKNSDGTWNDNYEYAYEWYSLDNEEWRDFDVVLPGVLPEGVLFANVSSQLEVAAYLRQCGYSDAGIAGIMGNIQQECGWNTNDRTGSYYGLCQWGGDRLANLISFCAANGYDYTSSSGQIAFLVYELPQRCGAVNEYLKTTTDVEMAAMEFAMGYEGCIRSTAKADDLLYTGTLCPSYTNKTYLQEMKKRISYANTYYGTITSGGLNGATGSITDIPAITQDITNRYQKTAVSFALSSVGSKYSQEKRFQVGYYDCSSLCYRAWQSAGIDISYNGATTAAGIAEGFYQKGQTVTFSQLQPGDMLFYSRKSNGRFMNITHVAMYVGNGMVVEARDEKHGVVYREASATGLNAVVLIGHPSYPEQ